MFKHILVPTDGSRLAERGVKTGIALAKALGVAAGPLLLLHIVLGRREKQSA